MAEIKWITSLDDGLKQANSKKRLALVDFFNPN